MIVGCNFRPLSGKRRIAYVLCLFLMLAAHGRVVLREAAYFTYRGEYPHHDGFDACTGKGNG